MDVCFVFHQVERITLIHELSIASIIRSKMSSSNLAFDLDNSHHCEVIEHALAMYKNKGALQRTSRTLIPMHPSKYCIPTMAVFM